MYNPFRGHSILMSKQKSRMDISYDRFKINYKKLAIFKFYFPK